MFLWLVEDGDSRVLGCSGEYRGMASYLYVATALALTVYGHIVIKMRANFHTANGTAVDQYSFLFLMFVDPWVISGFIAAVVAAASWMLAIRNADLSLLYPFMALTFVFIPLLAVILFGEKINGLQITGLLMIVGGVSLVTIAH